MITASNFGLLNYQFDFKHHSWNLGLDIIIPVIFLMALLQISVWINKIRFLNILISYFGKGSMCILLLHPLFIYINDKFLSPYIDSVWLSAFINIIQCSILYMLLTNISWGRIILGEHSNRHN